MAARILNAFQVGALLVSASYGIGFLLGSGELALQHGMGGSIYGVATAMGMLILTLFAGRLWRLAQPIWELFGNAYGDGIRRSVALLSVIWMAGVLAAQIHGGTAILTLLGMDKAGAYWVVLSAIFLASRLRLTWASTVFSFFLLASGLVLVYVLATVPGDTAYMHAPSRFLADLSSFRPAALMAIVIAVGVLVCTGGDYHQFVLAARSPNAAACGCALAALVLLFVSFMPASVVQGFVEIGQLNGLGEPKQVIPMAVLQGSRAMGTGVGPVLLAGLTVAALGSGAAILRAMSEALMSASRGSAWSMPTMATCLSMSLGATLALRGQGIIETMVSVNLLYIGSIAVVFVALLAGKKLTNRQAGAAMTLGFMGSASVCIASWLGFIPAGNEADLVSLAAGLIGSTVALVLTIKPDRELA